MYSIAIPTLEANVAVALQTFHASPLSCASATLDHGKASQFAMLPHKCSLKSVLPSEPTHKPLTTHRRPLSSQAKNGFVELGTNHRSNFEISTLSVTDLDILYFLTTIPSEI
jgi:hypothetical protein